MELLDIIGIIFILIIAIFSLKRGLIMSLIGLLGWIIAIIVSLALGPSISKGIQNLIKISSGVANLAGYLIIFILVLAVLGLIGSLLRKAIQLLKLGFFDRLLGFIFGCLKALVIIFIISFIAELMPLSQQTRNYISRSYVISFSEKFVSTIINATNLKQQIEKIRIKSSPHKDKKAI